MKKINLQVVVLLLIGCLATSSCIGSYSLFKKYTSWQLRMTNNKYVNAIVSWFLDIICIPVTLLVDNLVLNTIEFWSGENPIQANIGKTKTVIGEDGKTYAVTTLKDGYEVKNENGEVVNFTHNSDTDSWSVEQNGEKKELFRYNGDGTIQTEINGESKTLSLNEAGVYQARMMAQNGVFFAMK